MEKNVKNFAPLLYLDNVLLSFLRAYFSHHPIYPWNEDQSQSKIKIDDRFSDTGHDANFSPLLLIRRGPFSLTSLTLGGNDPEQGVNLAEWTQRRKKRYKAGAVYSIDIKTRTPKETLNLSEEIQTTLLAYTERIAEEFKVKIEEHIEASDESLSSSGVQKDYSIVTLSMAASYSYEMSFDIIPRYEKLQGIDFMQQIDKEIETQTKLRLDTLKFNVKT